MIAFPSNPSVNDTYTAAGKTWLWTGTAWQLQPRILTSADITDFATAVGNVAPPTTDASLLTSGTLPDARLSANVATSLGKANTALQSGAAISNISGLQTALDGKATSAQGSKADSALQPGAAISAISGLQTALDGKQAAGSYATLVGGVVPSSQLPSFVDDVVEFANLAAFPATGDSGKIYVALDSGKTYRWGGSTYVEISASPGSTDAVPEGSNNLYFTAQRAADAAPVQSVAGRTGDVTLGISDVDGLQTELNGKATSAQGAKADSALQPSLIDGLQAFYKLSDLSDSSGNNRTLTNNGNVTFASGKIGNAAVFDGQSYIESDLTEINNDFSVSGWFNLNEVVTYTAGFGINEYSNGLLFRLGSSIDQLYVFGSYAQIGEFNTNNWTHVVITGSNGTAKAYVNNVLAVTVSYDSTMGFGTTPNFIAGASRHDLGQELLNGSMDAVGIWNRALSDSEVASLYNNGTGLELTGKQPVGNYATLENGLVPYSQLPSATIYSDTAPASPTAGLEWVDTTELRSYRYYNNLWVEIDRA